MPARIAVADYGMGNRRSVEKALEKVGAEPVVTADAGVIQSAEALIVPGVGAFPEAMRKLEESDLLEATKRFAQSGKPVLGICLGMQVLFESSVEFEQTEGLGLIPGQVAELNAEGEKLPHIGWNEITWSQPSPLNAGLGETEAFYHVHSYAARCDERYVIGYGEYGGRFVSAVESENVFGVQFHPEKSSKAGLKLLENFVKLASA